MTTIQFTTEAPASAILRKVTFRNRGKAHRGFVRSNGRLVAACSCPGSQRGTLTNGATILCDGWEKANCKH